MPLSLASTPGVALTKRDLSVASSARRQSTSYESGANAKLSREFQNPGGFSLRARINFDCAEGLGGRQTTTDSEGGTSTPRSCIVTACVLFVRTTHSFVMSNVAARKGTESPS